MHIKQFCRLSVAGFLVSAGVVTAASAASLQISITNNQQPDGLYITPLLSILHDGSFDAFDSGSPASANVEAAAEEGRVPDLPRPLTRPRIHPPQTPIIMYLFKLGASRINGAFA